MLKAFGRSIPTTVHELLVEPCALVIWDMQNAIAARATNYPGLVQNIGALLRAARQSGVPVIYSQHFSAPLERESRVFVRQQWIRSGRPDPARLRPAWPHAGADMDIVSELRPVEGDLVLPKTRRSFFVGTPFRAYLAAANLDVVVIAGVSTNGGVLATAQEAANHGLFAVVVDNAVGAFSDGDQARGLADLAAVCDLCSTTDAVRAWTVAPAPVE